MFNTFNPMLNKENKWAITEASADEVNQAVELAAKPFKSYSKISGAKKAEFLKAIAGEIEDLGDQLLEVYNAESGLPNGRAVGEHGRTIGQLLAFANHIETGDWVDATIDTAQPERQPMAKVDLSKMNVALGSVVVFGASNFPLAFSTAGGDTAAALATGCPVIEPSCMLHPNIVRFYEANKAIALSQSGLEVLGGYENEINANYGRQVVTTVEGETFLNNPTLHHEVFGPFSLVVQCENVVQLEIILSKLEGQLTGTVISGSNEIADYSSIVSNLQDRVGRIIFNGVPTGVEVCASMNHGGPYPASTDSRFTAVGVDSIKRWVRPFSFQDWPNNLLPDALKNENPLGLLRIVNNSKTTDRI